MSARRLVAIPILLGLATFAAGLLAGPGTSASAVVLRIGNESGKILGMVGCLAAVVAFDPGDYLRGAWSLLCSCFALMLLRDLTLVAPIGALFGSAVRPFGVSLLLCANAALIAGTWRLARTWSAAQLSDIGNAHRFVFVALFIVGSIVAIPSTVSDAKDAASGDWIALATMASRLGDILSLALLGPVVVTARALRGGALTWIWTLLGASLFAWVAFDVSLAGDFAAHPERASWAELFRVLACGFTMSSGLAQRHAIVADFGVGAVD